MSQDVLGCPGEDLSGLIQDFTTKLRNGTITPMEAKRFLRKEGPSGTSAIFRLNFGDGRSPRELLKAGNYDRVGEGAREFVESEDFPVEPRGESGIELLQFDFDPTSEQVLEGLERRGLDRPRPEDALRFGEKYPEEQRKGSIVFLHEPWTDPRGYRGVLVLDRGGQRRGLGCGWFDVGWGRGFRFAGRSRK